MTQAQTSAFMPREEARKEAVKQHMQPLICSPCPHNSKMGPLRSCCTILAAVLSALAAGQGPPPASHVALSIPQFWKELEGGLGNFTVLVAFNDPIHASEPLELRCKAQGNEQGAANETISARLTPWAVNHAEAAFRGAW